MRSKSSPGGYSKAVLEVKLPPGSCLCYTKTDVSVKRTGASGMVVSKKRDFLFD